MSAAEAQSEVLPFHQNTLLDELGIPPVEKGRRIGTLILCGQGPVQDRATKVKIGSQDGALPGTIEHHEANIWMRLIARAAGSLDTTGEVGLIIPSGGGTRSGTYEKGGVVVAPTEAELMADITQKLSGTHAEVLLEPAAHNTLDNLLNALTILDARRRRSREAGLPPDPNDENVWLLVSHFHLPRIRVLASFFGLDPTHVLSAEQVALVASSIKQASRPPLPNADGFDRQQSFQALIRARLGSPVTAEHAGYFNRKRDRASGLLGRVIDRFLAKGEVPEADRAREKEAIGNKLSIEEQKSAQMRMRDERRWVRGLVSEADYLLPYAQRLGDDERLWKFLMRFDRDQLGSYGIDRDVLAQATDDARQQVLTDLRRRMEGEDWLKTRWRWQVVKEEWVGEEYPQSVKDRFQQLGIGQEDIDALSNARVPTVV